MLHEVTACFLFRPSIPECLWRESEDRHKSEADARLMFARESAKIAQHDTRKSSSPANIAPCRPARAPRRPARRSLRASGKSGCYALALKSQSRRDRQHRALVVAVSGAGARPSARIQMLMMFINAAEHAQRRPHDAFTLERRATLPMRAALFDFATRENAAATAAWCQRRHRESASRSEPI